MLKNYFITAFRNMTRHRFFSIINLTGLVFSIAVCLVFLSIIKNQYEIDNYHAGKDRIYRVTSNVLQSDRESMAFATTPEPIKEELSRNNANIEAAAFLRPLYFVKAQTASKDLQIEAAFTSPSFFEIFSYDCLNGGCGLQFNDPNKIILTRETAKKFFGNADPIGKTIEI
ncbi:MAG TPA: ABC transporter permease, partial [Chitinophagaceae bacterium]|nr:ABC transporter permease [Chitinophagaceae bacterium]